MRRAIISVGAGKMQYEFVKRLKKTGLLVVAFGCGRNSEKTIELCDYFAEIDTNDAEIVIDWLECLQRKQALIYVGAGSYAGGVAIKTLQLITNHFNLPTKVPQRVVAGMDKYEQQIMYQKYGLSNITTYPIQTLMEDNNCIEKSKKYIIKPFVGRGSQGVECLVGEELIRSIKEQKIGADMVVQSFVEGKEYRVLMIVQAGQIKLLAPILRESYANFLLGRLQLDTSDYEVIREHAECLIKNLSLTNSIIKYDLIVSENGINLIEMDIGVGGGFYFKEYISRLTQTEIMDIYIKLIQGENIPEISCSNSELVMDYIYNEHEVPVEYELEACIRELSKLVGDNSVLINCLRPENKGKYSSNADFVFASIHCINQIDIKEINKYINQFCFKEKKK